MNKDFFFLVFYGRTSVILGVCIYIIVRFLRKGWIKLNFNTMLDCKFKEWLKRHKKIFSIIANIGMVYCLTTIPDTIVPAIKDIPHVMNDDYVYLEGKVMKTSMPGSNNNMERHDLFIIDKNGKEINLDIYGKGELRKGTTVQVEYLPYSLNGVLVGRGRH